ncbi:MAG: carotenoid oxygenase family protein [Pseudomonadales bacterium]
MTQPAAFHLEGNYAPVSEEVTATNLKVIGELPEALHGLYVRNGPNPAAGSSGHWFVGDGMLHGLSLSGGKASWYRNRWVQTPVLNKTGTYMKPDGTVDRTVGVANTHVIRHHNKIFALVENAFPIEVTPELDTVGSYDFGGKLTSAMTAHPKICPVSGDLLFFGYHWAPPYLTYNRANAQGELVLSRDIDVTGPTMIHDFAITEHFVIFMDLPVVFNLDKAMAGTAMPYEWSETYPARLGLLPRDDEHAAVRWFDIDPCYVFHPMNAFDDGNTVTLDVARYDTMWQADHNDFQSAYLTRWLIDLNTGQVKETQLSDLAIEFPRTNDDFQGLAYRFGYGPVQDDNKGSPLIGQIAKFDLERGRCDCFDFAEPVVPGEFVFAKGEGQQEDDGYLVGYGYRSEANASAFYVFSARDAGSKPLARVDIPQRIPFGFHGSWLPQT